MTNHSNLAPPTRSILLGLSVGGGAFAILVLLATSAGRSAGHAQGARERAALETVWPNLMQLPEMDRAVIVGLAMTCKLHRRDLGASDARDQVIGCLNDAATDPDAALPRGVDRAKALDTYRRLLLEAP